MMETAVYILACCIGICIGYIARNVVELLIYRQKTINLRNQRRAYELSLDVYRAYIQILKDRQAKQAAETKPANE